MPPIPEESAEAAFEKEAGRGRAAPKESPEESPEESPDKTAGERLVSQDRRLRLFLAYLAGSAVRRRVEVGDLAQEVYLRVLSSDAGLPAREPGEGALWALLATVARRVVIDVARAARARKRSAREAPLERSDWSRFAPGVAAPGPGPFTRAALRDEEARLAAAFDRLSPEHRRVIGLRRLEGASARETAARMGRSETAVHSLYRRALQAWESAAAGPGHGFPGSRDESAADPRSPAHAPLKPDGPDEP